MKISNAGLDSQLKGIEAKQNQAEKTGLGKKPQAGEKDAVEPSKINMSERAQMMAKAKEIAHKTEPDNSEKIARLQKMIDEGSYKVDAEAVADRLVDSHLIVPE